MRLVSRKTEYRQRVMETLRQHQEFAETHEKQIAELQKDLTEARKLLAQLAGWAQAFSNMGFWARLRWVFLNPGAKSPENKKAE
jgi:hypothetical protein